MVRDAFLYETEGAWSTAVARARFVFLHEDHCSVPLFSWTYHGFAQEEVMYTHHKVDEFRHGVHGHNRIFCDTAHAS